MNNENIKDLCLLIYESIVLSTKYDANISNVEKSEIVLKIILNVLGMASIDIIRGEKASQDAFIDAVCIFLKDYFKINGEEINEN